MYSVKKSFTNTLYPLHYEPTKAFQHTLTDKQDFFDWYFKKTKKGKK